MEESQALKIIQLSKVEPLHETRPSSLPPTSLPLTFFDLLWLRFPPVEYLFFYEFQNSTTFFYDSLLPHLKHSLSITLQNYLPFVGSIIWPLDSSKPFINYVLGDAVSFTIAESSANFNLLSSDFCEAKEKHHLIPHLYTSHERASLIAIQVTLFPNNGFCIGITYHHAALDGKSLNCFMKSWAETSSKLVKSPSSSTSLLLLPENLTPFFDRSVIKDPTEIGEVFAGTWLNHGGPNNRSVKVWEHSSKNGVQAGLFELTPTHIQNLKEYANSKLKLNVQLSTFSITCAYVLSCLAKAEQPKFDNVVFAFSVDCRARLDPPISPSYLGSCIAGQGFMVETEKLLGKDGFISALEGMNEALNRVKDGSLLKGAESWISHMFNVSEKTKLYSTAGSPRFNVYSIDFGFGRPKKVEISSIEKTGAISIFDSRNNSKGIQIGLVLNKPEMKTFSTLFVQGLESL